MDRRVFIYLLNAADQIVAVNDEWVDFALENGAPELSRKNVIARTIWEFIVDPDTCYIYRLVLDEVRTRQREVTVTYRCDSPTVRRYMQLTCRPRRDDAVEIRSRMVREEPVEHIDLWDRDVPRTEDFIRACAWCKSVMVAEGEWLPVEAAVSELGPLGRRAVPQISHSICPECHLEKLNQIRTGSLVRSTA